MKGAPTVPQFPLLDSQSGPRITINEFLKDPLLIRELVLRMTSQGFIADALLRNAGQNASGVVKYRESSPIYANTDAQTRAEFAEVPIAETSEGEPKMALVEERALAIVVSDEMRRRMSIDPVQRQLLRVRNTMFRSWDRTFFDMIFDHPGVQHLAVPQPWSSTTTTARQDILEAIDMVERAAPDGIDDAEFDFEPDTLVIGTGTRTDLMGNEKFNQVYQGDIASENLLYRGKLPRQIMNLDVLVSRRVRAGKALVMQRNIAGFRSDELPLDVTPLYRDEPRKMSRADVQRATAMGLDQPKAIVVLDGVAA
jgi:hypothetical protein